MYEPSPYDYSEMQEAEIMFIPDTIDAKPIPQWVVSTVNPILVPEIPEIITDQALWKLENALPENNIIPKVYFEQGKSQYEIAVDSVSSDKNWLYLNQQGFIQRFLFSLEWDDQAKIKLNYDYDDTQVKERLKLEWLEYYYTRYDDFMRTNYPWDYKSIF